MSATIEYRWARGASGVIHAVVPGGPAAACGREPARGRGGPVAVSAPTCDRCRRKLGMGPAPAPRAGGGAR